jgi:hypothetical protein
MRHGRARRGHPQFDLQTQDAATRAGMTIQPDRILR